MRTTLFLFVVGLAISQQLNEKPIIGILTIPCDISGCDPNDYSYFPASYVKFLEMGGAMVVPIPWDADYDLLDFYLSRVNAILFTGGDTELYLNATSPGYNYNKFTETATYLLQQVMQFNKAGKFFPIFGICQGFQLLNYIAGGYKPVLTGVADDVGVQRLLNITEPDSVLYRTMPADIKAYLSSKVGPYYSHHWGVLPSTYEQNQVLSSFFKITAIGNDAIGTPYVASMQAHDYPIYGVQYHPEKHQFEWMSKAVHDTYHVRYSQHMANTFVGLAQLNANRFTDQEIFQHIIYNYSPTNKMSIPNTSFVQVYLFNRQ